MPIKVDHLVRSKRRTIALIIQPDGSLTVRAPLFMPDGTIHRFVDAHQKWIYKKQEQAIHSTHPPERQFVNGETFPFFGREVPLTIIASKRPSLNLTDGQFSLSDSALPRARHYFIQWYKKRTREVILTRLTDFSKKYGFSWQKLNISSARTRWGSCGFHGTLNFTWRLVTTPPQIIDYVIIHELVHTQIRNHSPQFWKRVSELMPDYKQNRAWLKKNNRLLIFLSE